ncbi:epimerase family protein [Mycobacterium xenopi 3993]|nr:epimerase family protein [Mycobacterium xenopi 3993]
MLVNASAVGYYGNTKDRQVDETASAGSGFLAQLCQDWEAATAAAQQVGAVSFWPHRAGAGRRAGCWADAPAVLAGPGARLGNGRQYISWISLEDEVRALQFAISHDGCPGR